MHVAGVENVDSFEPQLQSFHHVSSGGCSQPEACQSRPICKQGPFFYNVYATNCIEIKRFFCILQISRVPIFSPLPNLIRLNLSSNQLEKFPPTLGRDERTPLLPHLKYLDLRSNQIRGVPDHNMYLKDLEELNISKNQIKDLPVQFLASFLSLKTLDASRNELGKGYEVIILCICIPYDVS